MVNSKSLIPRMGAGTPRLPTAGNVKPTVWMSILSKLPIPSRYASKPSAPSAISLHPLSSRLPQRTPSSESLTSSISSSSSSASSISLEKRRAAREHRARPWLQLGAPRKPVASPECTLVTTVAEVASPAVKAGVPKAKTDLLAKRRKVLVVKKTLAPRAALQTSGGLVEQDKCSSSLNGESDGVAEEMGRAAALLAKLQLKMKKIPSITKYTRKKPSANHVDHESEQAERISRRIEEEKRARRTGRALRSALKKPALSHPAEFRQSEERLSAGQRCFIAFRRANALKHDLSLDLDIPYVMLNRREKTLGLIDHDCARPTLLSTEEANANLKAWGIEPEAAAQRRPKVSFQTGASLFDSVVDGVSKPTALWGRHHDEPLEPYCPANYQVREAIVGLGFVEGKQSKPYRGRVRGNDEQERLSRFGYGTYRIETDYEEAEILARIGLGTYHFWVSDKHQKLDQWSERKTKGAIKARKERDEETREHARKANQHRVLGQLALEKAQQGSKLLQPGFISGVVPSSSTGEQAHLVAGTSRFVEDC